MPRYDVPDVHRIEQALKVAPKEMEFVLLGDLNLSLREPWENRGEELVLALAGSRLGNMTANFTPRRRYQRKGS